jgi:hypothetical protein
MLEVLVVVTTIKRLVEEEEELVRLDKMALLILEVMVVVL